MKKILVICLVCVLGVAALGLGYAAWQKTLTINGTVNTSEIGAKIEAGTVVPGSSNIGDCTTNYSAYPGNEGFTVVITNTCPGDTFTIPTTVTNTGLMPIHGSFTTTDPATGVTITNPADYSIATTNPDSAATDNLVITITDDAPQASDLTFTITSQAIQGLS